MLSPGTYSLCAAQITSNTDRNSGAKTPITGLGGIQALSIDVDFKYGSGGQASGVAVIMQTSVDKGTTWRDIAYFVFSQVSAVKQANLEGMLSKGVTAYADLAAEGVNDGILFDQYRAVIVSTGTVYANTSVAVNIAAR